MVFSKMVGLAVGGPAFGDFKVQVLPPAIDGMAFALGALAVVVAPNLEGMAQLIHILVASRSIPEPEEPGQAVADGVQVIVQQARPTGRLQGKPVGLVLNKGFNPIGFDVGKDLQLPRPSVESPGT
jgi:hypothetical protein